MENFIFCAVKKHFVNFQFALLKSLKAKCFVFSDLNKPKKNTFPTAELLG